MHSSVISLMAAKSWMGHSEPAAGVMGLAQAHMALQNHMHLPILHLHHMNPHVASAIRHGPASGQFQIMRQHAGMSSIHSNSSSSSSLRCGVSAFAFQGTNAHAIIEQAPSGLSHCQLAQAVGTARTALQWQRNRLWIAAAAQALLTGKGNPLCYSWLHATHALLNEGIHVYQVYSTYSLCVCSKLLRCLHSLLVISALFSHAHGTTSQACNVMMGRQDYTVL